MSAPSLPPGGVGDEDAARITGVLAEYGYANSDVTRIERLPTKVKNVNYRVRAGGGDWVLKCHPAASRLAVPQRLELALADAGVPVAELQRTRSGQTVVERDGLAFTLHAWVEGQQIALDSRDACLTQYPGLVGELGTAVGAIHRVGSALAEANPSPVDAAQLLAGPRRTVRNIRRGRPPGLFKSSRLLLRADKTSFDRWILRTLPDLYREARVLAGTSLLERLRSCDLVLAHNDLNWENLVFDPAMHLVAVLDFDNAGLLPRDLDAGAAAAVLAGPDPGRLARFIEACEAASNARLDPDLVNLGMRWKCTRSLLWSIDAYLSGRVHEPGLVANWCHHLDDCLRQLPPLAESGVGRSRWR